MASQEKSQWQQHFIPSSMLAGSYLNITSTEVPYLTDKSALIEEKLINWADPHEPYETHYFTICYLNSWTAACVKQTETKKLCLFLAVPSGPIFKMNSSYPLTHCCFWQSAASAFLQPSD